MPGDFSRRGWHGWHRANGMPLGIAIPNWKPSGKFCRLLTILPLALGPINTNVFHPCKFKLLISSIPGLLFTKPSLHQRCEVGPSGSKGDERLVPRLSQSPTTSAWCTLGPGLSGLPNQPNCPTPIHSVEIPTKGHSLIGRERPLLSAAFFSGRRDNYLAH